MEKFLLCIVLVSGSYAGTRYAASPAKSSVDSAYALCASSGDTLCIDSGTGNWGSSCLTVSKSVVIKGAGGHSTHIINDSVQRGAVSLLSISPAADIPIRVTGIFFDLDTCVNNDRSGIKINGNVSGKFPVSKIRIDSCWFYCGDRQVWWYGWCEGLVDHCTFLNGNISVMVQGDDQHSWSRAIKAGTSHAVFIEDNLFMADTTYGKPITEHFIYHQSGGRSVTRHNTFNALLWANHPFFDTHGNFGPFANPISSRGQPIVEVYNNVFEDYQMYWFIQIRGGANVIYNNLFNTTHGSVSFVIKLEEEDGWKKGGPFCPSCPTRTAWPAWDNINNSFFWNNRYNGKPDSSLGYDPGNESTDSLFVRKNRDFFLHAPQPSGGYEYWTGSPGDTTMAFVQGPNLYYPYYAFAYPHPLTGVAPALSVASLSAQSGPTGSTIAITASGLQSTRGQGYVRFGADAQAVIVNWSNTAATVVVPAVSPGIYRLFVVNNDCQVDSTKSFSVSPGSSVRGLPDKKPALSEEYRGVSAVTIYTIAGRKIFTMRQRTGGAGADHFSTGKSLSPGMYVASVRRDSRERTMPLFVER